MSISLLLTILLVPRMMMTGPLLSLERGELPVKYKVLDSLDPCLPADILGIIH